MVSTKIISILLVTMLVALAGCQTQVQEPVDTTGDDPATGELGNEIDVDDADDGIVPETTDEEEVVEEDRMDVEGSSDETGVKEFFVEGQNYYFTIDGKVNPDIVVNEGDTVRINFKSIDGRHDWKLFGYDYPTTGTTTTGGSGSVEFVAEKAGTFQYFCSVGSHRKLGMEGNFIVQ